MRRAAENELLFRAVNEEIDELADELPGAASPEPQVWDFVCECDDRTCRTQLPMTQTEYERIHANPRRFVVAPSAAHVSDSIETVVDRSSRYWVVEKHGEAGRLVEEA